MKNLNKDKQSIIYDHEVKMLSSIKKEGYQGYSFETVRNYDNIKMIKNGNLSEEKYFKNNYYHELSPYEVIFVKQRLNHTNNALLFYLKSKNIELIKLESNNIINENKLIEIKPIEIPIINNKTIKTQSIISIKNVINDNKNKKIFNAVNKKF
jgi:hypothetical protein